MNIAFVTSHVYPFRKGGTERRVYEIGRRLGERGHDVTVYGAQWWDDAATIEYENMTLRGVSRGRDPYVDDRRSISEALRFSADLLRPLRRNVHEHDLIDVCVSEHFPVWSSQLASVLQGTPLVTTWHEVWDFEYWTEYLGSLGPFGWTVQSITAKLPQRPIAVSATTANRLARIGPDRNRIDVVPYGVETGSFLSTPPADDAFDVLYVGRLIPEKNVDLLLSAFDEVADSRDVTLGIIGDGPQRRALESHAASLTHGNEVTFLGFLDDDEDVYAHMRGADVFVLPSTREGFGITVLESMAAGCTPVVVSHRDSAVSEIVGDCAIETDESASAIAEAIESALAGRVPAVNPVEEARKYEWDEVARRAERVYEEATT